MSVEGSTSAQTMLLRSDYRLRDACPCSWNHLASPHHPDAGRDGLDRSTDYKERILSFSHTHLITAESEPDAASSIKQRGLDQSLLGEAATLSFESHLLNGPTGSPVGHLKLVEACLEATRLMLVWLGLAAQTTSRIKASTSTVTPKKFESTYQSLELRERDDQLPELLTSSESIFRLLGGGCSSIFRVRRYV